MEMTVMLAEEAAAQPSMKNLAWVDDWQSQSRVTK